MKRDWRKSASGRHYYTGSLGGDEHFLYFKFDLKGNPNHGHWYIGKDLDNPDSALFYAAGGAIPYPASQSCPNDSVDDFWYYMPENKPIRNFEFKCKLDHEKTRLSDN